MKTNQWIMAAVLAGLASANVLAATPQDMAKQYNCLACHSVDKKVVGPAFKEIASKYKGQNAEAKLVEKVKKGGAGSFGPIPMSPNPNVPDADLKVMVKWVLSQ
ncbi:c-type cytochrome [Pseudogulbenkiania sp. MAI-1]|uniref:c-type cytochrome n=1 Tax=Pseudogulbenkiania sp. MAI-1 TaxID=990370 RepID=UPI00045E6AF1|nr:c-type cytochrome [Pseudogulbenkiania sp. MAI-1]